MSQVSSGIGVATEFTLKRDRFSAELRALENEVRSATTRMSATPITLRAVFDTPAALTAFRGMQVQLQAQASANPVVIPVVYQQMGGPPGAGGGGGGGGMPMGSASPNFSYWVGQLQNTIQQGQPTSSPNWPLLFSMRGAGAGGGGTGGGFGGRALFRYAMVARAGYDTSEAAYNMFAASGRSGIHQLTGRGYTTDELQENEDTIAAGQNAIRKIPLVGGVIAGIGSGANRFGSSILNAVRGRGFQSDVGYGERMKEVVKLEDEHTKQLEQQARHHGRILEHVEREEITLKKQIDLQQAGGDRTGIAYIKAESSRSELTRLLATPDYRDAKGHLTGNALDLRNITLRAIQSQLGTDLRSAAAQDFADYTNAGLRIAGIDERATVTELRTSGRGREAGYLTRRNALDDRLTRLGVDYATETDTTKRRYIAEEYRATAAGNQRERRAINLEESDDVGQIQRQAALDVSNTRARTSEDVLASTGDRGMISARASGRRRASLAQVIRAGNDYFDENDPAKKEAAKQRWMAEVNRHQSEEAIINQDEQRQNRGLDFSRAGMVQRARDIELEASGHGGLADVMDIGDELAHNLSEARNDPQARGAAIALAHARYTAALHPQVRAQIFGSTQGYLQSLQLAGLNTDAEGMKKAAEALKNLDKNGQAIVNGQKVPGEENPFGKAANEFNDATDKFSKSVNDLAGRQLFILSPA